MRLGKLVQKDTILEARRFSTSPDGHISDIQSVKIPIQKGGMCILDILGIHMNREWDLDAVRRDPDFFSLSSAIHWGNDVHEFRPERFMDTGTYKWPRDACTCSVHCP